MSADTTYFVEVAVKKVETIEIRAVTMAEAIQKAERKPGVISVERAEHWNEYATRNSQENS